MSNPNGDDRRKQDATSGNDSGGSHRAWPTWLVFVAVIAGLLTFLGVLALLGLLA